MAIPFDLQVVHNIFNSRVSIKSSEASNSSVKKCNDFPVPSRDGTNQTILFYSILTKLSLAGKNLIIPGQGEFG
jgi:hypothetical protein